MAFGKEIKRLKEKEKISAEKLASAIGVNADRLRKWMQKDFSPRGEDLRIIESSFQMPLDEIMKLQRLPEFLIVPNTTKKEKPELHLAPQGRFPKKAIPGQAIPFYDVDFAAGDIEFYNGHASIKAAYTMDIPEFAGCTAFRTYGTSMEKLIKSGCILFGTKVEDWQTHLEYGQIYGIVCHDKRRYLKYIRKATDDSHFLLKSENREQYDDFTIPKSKIKSIWLIHGWINKRT